MITKVTIETDDPIEAKDMMDGPAWQALLWKVDQWLRDKLKYGHEYKTADEAFQAAKDQIYSEMLQGGLEWTE